MMKKYRWIRKNRKMRKTVISKAAAMIMIGTLTGAVLMGCSSSAAASAADAQVQIYDEQTSADGQASAGSQATADGQASAGSQATAGGQASSAVSVVSAGGGVLDGAELFTDRDLVQEADLTDAVSYTVEDGNDIHIAQTGVYVITGTASDVTIYVEADSEDKVQLVLDNLSITNEDFPCIYVLQADKTFITLTGENSLSVTGTFVKDGDTNTDGVIFSKDDLVLNGTGGLTVSSTDNGIVCKDDLKITGGSYMITAASKTFEANDSIRIAGGTFSLKAGTDAFHAENDEDNSLGYVYISGGTIAISAGDDGIHATTVVQIDGGTVSVDAAEGIEGTVIQINNGTIDITAGDDGINAARKSSSYTPRVEINGGVISVSMGAGDTDGIDSNGDIIINGGTVTVTGNSTFDYDGTAQLNGGTVIVNGQQVDTIPNQFMGGPGAGGFGGNQGGFGGNQGDFGGNQGGMNGGQGRRR